MSGIRTVSFPMRQNRVAPCIYALTLFRFSCSCLTLPRALLRMDKAEAAWYSGDRYPNGLKRTE